MTIYSNQYKPIILTSNTQNKPTTKTDSDSAMFDVHMTSSRTIVYFHRSGPSSFTPQSVHFDQSPPSTSPKFFILWSYSVWMCLIWISIIFRKFFWVGYKYLKLRWLYGLGKALNLTKIKCLNTLAPNHYLGQFWPWLSSKKSLPRLTSGSIRVQWTRTRVAHGLENGFRHAKAVL